MIINVQFPIVGGMRNTSAQVGDYVYYVPLDVQGAFDVDGGNIILLGLLVDIGINSIVVAYDNVNGPPLPPQGTEYLMFSKNAEANVSRILGYYAELTFKNNSNEYVELFSVGSEITENSK